MTEEQAKTVRVRGQAELLRLLVRARNAEALLYRRKSELEEECRGRAPGSDLLAIYSHFAGFREPIPLAEASAAWEMAKALPSAPTVEAEIAKEAPRE